MAYIGSKEVRVVEWRRRKWQWQRQRQWRAGQSQMSVGALVVHIGNIGHVDHILGHVSSSLEAPHERHGGMFDVAFSVPVPLPAREEGSIIAEAGSDAVPASATTTILALA